MDSARDMKDNENIRTVVVGNNNGDSVWWNTKCSNICQTPDTERL